MVLYSGIDSRPDTSGADGESVRHEFEIQDGAALLIHVGRWSPEKNHERLLRIYSSFVRRVPNSCLLLVGSMNEPVLSGVRKLVRELNLQTKVIECGSRSDVGRLLSTSDLMLFPSLREGLPGTVVEAAAVGTPVLASDLAPMLEISRYLPIRTMSLLESDEAWSAACVELCKDTTIRSRLIGAFAASPFTIPATVAAFQRVYRVAGDAHEQYA
jgi:glycosyltransferase involved in cell wall biosynthesis